MATRDEILDAALRLGAACGWEKLTLDAVARDLQISLAGIYIHFPQKDDLVDAWFDRADQAMLAHFPKPLDSDGNASGAERLEVVIRTWLHALAPYHKLTGEMLLYKLEPGHVHLQAAGILRISRTVQWFREAAGLEASHLKRIGQELALTSLFLTIFVAWLNDRSEEQHKSMDRLKQLLHKGEGIQLWL
ncbi:MAG: TetR/AcrR family transcriptional regulator [Idiomarina sp.]|nr:TetR/AcrR family transcriptional regulator [Idiomarina sp.]